MNGKTLIYLLSLLVLCSCQPNKEQHIETFIDSSIPVSSQDIRLSSIVTVKNIIPLETNDLSLIGDYGKILKFENRFYISSNRNTLLVFDDKGKHINNIGKVGSGPGEYEMVGDFDVTQEGIYIRGNKCVLQYSHDGTFIRSIAFDVNLFGINIAGDKILGFVTSEEHISHIFNMEGECINKFHPASTTAKIGQSSYYWPYGEGKYFLPFAFTNDLVTYDVQNDRFGYAQLIDLPDMLTLKMADLLSEEQGRNVNRKEHARIVWPLNSNAKQFYFITQGKDEKDDILWIKDFTSQSCQAYYCQHISNDISFRPVKRFFSSFTRSDNSFLSIVSPEELKKKLAQGEDTGSPYIKRMQELAETLTDEDNFILIEYDFK